MPEPRHERGVLDTSVIIDLDELDPLQLPISSPSVPSPSPSSRPGRMPRMIPTKPDGVRTVFNGPEPPSTRCPSMSTRRAYGRIFSSMVAAGRKAREHTGLTCSWRRRRSRPSYRYTRNGDDFRTIDGLVEVVVV